MLTGELRSKVDALWNAFWSGGIANPIEVIEQITYLLFLRRLDDLHTVEERKAQRLGKPIERRVYPEGSDERGRAYEDMRWSRFKNFEATEMFKVVGEHVFPFLRSLGGDGSTYSLHMKDARFTIPTPALLAKVVDLMDQVPMDDRDTKGDLYEYMLGKIASAGQNGQFRTPRHIIRLMVEMTAPTPKDAICDPASGTCGFLVAAGEYSLDQAVFEKHLVPPTAVSVPLKFQRQGIKYNELSEAEKEQWDALEWSDDGSPPPSTVDAAALNKWLFNADTVDKVLGHLMTRGHQVAGGDRLGKTIVFAASNDHAEFIAERFNINYPEHKGEFARVVTYKTEYAQSLIDDFSKKDKAPHIAISVDMLDTGIDVPEVVNLVFFKIVRSRTKFWQMVGRGTRLCPDLFGPGQHKTGFYLFDYCQNLEFFAQNPGATAGGSPESLSSRLFGARVQLIAALDGRLQDCPGVHEAAAKYSTPDDEALRTSAADVLQQTVEAMNVDNFVVRPHRRLVEKFSKPEAWKKLAEGDQQELIHEVAGLPSERRDDDEEAKRFDLLILRTQLAILQASPDFNRLRDQVREIAGALELQEAVPAIKAEIVFIQALAGDEWWTDVSLGMLENARKRLRALVKLIEKAARKIVYTDFVDQLGTETTVVLPEIANGLDMERFKDKARQFLKGHEDHLALQRLRRSQPLTPTDLGELEQMLVQAGGTPEMIGKVAAGSRSLGIFIRSLVGMDREAVYQAFNEFVRGTNATPDQLEFIDVIVSELTVNGVVEAKRLYESPYLDISPQGPEALFPSAQVDRMFQILEEFKMRAAA